MCHVNYVVKVGDGPVDMSITLSFCGSFFVFGSLTVELAVSVNLGIFPTF